MTVRVLHGDCRDVLATLPDSSVHCVVTSPPYWGLRDYNVAGQLGLEETPESYLANMLDVFRSVRRVLRDDGTLWLNMGDSYNNFRSTMGPGQGLHGRDELRGKPAPDSRKRGWKGAKEKDLVGMPWRLAFALQVGGWWLRSDIIWSKPNPMPESVTDRPTKAHEYIFLLTKSARYFYDNEAVKELGTGRDPGNVLPHKHDDGTTLNRTKAGLRNIAPSTSRNLRSVWTIASAPFAEAHFSTFPPLLAEICIKAGTSEKGCCPSCGAPLVRDIERTGEWRAPHNGNNAKHNGTIYRTNPGGGIAGANTSRMSIDRGFRSSCACPSASPAPCTVLDPFSGAGTTMMVADRLQRDAIGIELNPEYVEMAQARIGRDQGPLLELMG